METTKENRSRRFFSPEQKATFVQQVKTYRTIQEGCEKLGIHSTQYRQWARQLDLSIRAGLRSSRPSKSAEMRRLEIENEQLRSTLLNLTIHHMAVKKIVH